MSTWNTWSLPYEDYETYLKDCLKATRLRLEAVKHGNHPSTFSKAITIERLISYRLSITAESDTFPLVRLSHLFSLQPLQRHTLLVALLYALDFRYGHLYATKKTLFTVPTIGLCVQSFPQEKTEDWFYTLSEDFCNFFFQKPPYHFSSFWERFLFLNDDISAFLIDGSFPQQPFLSLEQGIQASTEDTPALPKNSLLHIYGEHGCGKLHYVKNQLFYEKNILMVSLSTYLQQKKDAIETLIDFLYRTSQLHDTPICFYDIEPEYLKKIELLQINSILQKSIARFGFAILLTEQEIKLKNDLFFDIDVIQMTPPPLSPKEQVALWQDFSQKIPVSETLDFQPLSMLYHLTPGNMKKSLRKATELGNGILSMENLQFACRTSFHTLETLGVYEISEKVYWDALILAKKEKDILRHACNFIHCGYTVYESWGFSQKLPYGKNLSILMEGPPGTGKTMAARVLAHDIGLPLFQLNVAKVVSKYIGETEKNLNRIFTEAEKANAVLFIDEMDTLFSKRTEVRDSHDKYANMETSFLLQKIESYSGVLLLATNFLNNIDEAFLRRIKFIVHFSLPQKEERLQIWNGIFPPPAPLHADIDFPFLAEQFPLSGGEIKNIALKAAFFAAGEQTSIQMRHILSALKSEYTKQGKVLLQTDFGKYAYLYPKE